MLSKLRAMLAQTFTFLTVGWITFVFPHTSPTGIAWKVILAEVVSWVAWIAALALLRMV